MKTALSTVYKIDNLIFTRVKTRFQLGENELIYKISWKNSYLHTMFWNWRTTTNLWARAENEVTWPIWTIFNLISCPSSVKSFGSHLHKFLHLRCTNQHYLSAQRKRICLVIFFSRLMWNAIVHANVPRKFFENFRFPFTVKFTPLFVQ